MHRYCKALLGVANGLEKLVIWAGTLASWLILPLVFVIIFDALFRKFVRFVPFISDYELYQFLNSPVLQDLEWHLHAVVFLCSLGYAYVYNAHVRLDIYRPRLGSRGRLWVEFLGGIGFLLPFLSILIYYAWDFFATAYVMDETGGSGNEIDNRWLIKSFILKGPVLLFLSAASILLRLAVRLFGPLEYHEATRLRSLSDASHSAFN
ncbi:MAG: TRAP transporter small permease subunit [Rhodospirillales bacterium]|nr:TRAP transporter small permease subunit [Rhodospirillales bacterium]